MGKARTETGTGMGTAAERAGLYELTRQITYHMAVAHVRRNGELPSRTAGALLFQSVSYLVGSAAESPNMTTSLRWSGARQLHHGAMRPQSLKWYVNEDRDHAGLISAAMLMHSLLYRDHGIGDGPEDMNILYKPVDLQIVLRSWGGLDEWGMLDEHDNFFVEPYLLINLDSGGLDDRYRVGLMQ